MTKPIQNSAKEQIEELKKKVILSLGEWKELVQAFPNLIRNAPEYTLDALEHAGVEKYVKYGKSMVRFKSLSLSQKKDERLIGHEQTQAKLYQVLKTLCRNNSKMILLIGPNGSAKSTLWNAVSYAMEAYSRTFEGSRYCIEWVFPYDQTFSKPMGFSHLYYDEEDEKPEIPEQTFAFMDDEKIERITCDANCNPALLYTRDSQKVYFRESKSKLLEDEELCPKCYIIIKELLEVYKTKTKALTVEDPDEVLKLISRHIRIKKTEISKTYQEGIAVIDPNTDPRSLSYKERVPYYMKKGGPEILKNIMEKLPEFEGPLSKAANGLLIMEDSLESILSFISQFLNDKRKINISGERFKLDVMLVGSINPEKFLLIKENPEFNRFISRLEMIYVPYLLSYSKEADVYKIKVDDLRRDYHIAPHTEIIFALFSVMTRLRPIMGNKSYEKEYEDNKRIFKLKNKLKNVTMLQKAKMYDSEEMPKRTPEGDVFTSDEQEIVADNMDLIYNEWAHEEGRGYGISYREVDAIIDRALMESHSGFLSPISLMNELKYIIRTESQDYPFLQAKNNIFENPNYLKLIDYLEEEYFVIINQEVRDIFDLDFREQIITSLESYLFEGLKRVFYEKGVIKNKGGADITKTFLEDREVLIFGHPLDNQQRQAYWFKYAGEANPNGERRENVTAIFSRQIKDAQQRIYTEKKNEISQYLDDILLYLETGKLDMRTTEEAEKISGSVKKLYSRGYNKDSAQELVGYLKGNQDKLVDTGVKAK